MNWDKKWDQKIYRLVLLLGLVFIVFFGGIGLLTRASARQPSESTVSERDPDIQLFAPNLFDDYYANEVAADMEYKGQIIGVSGIVQSVSKDFVGNIIVKLETKHLYSYVHVRLNDSQRDLAARLTRGQPIYVIGKCMGMTLGSPVLDNCVIKK